MGPLGQLEPFAIDPWRATEWSDRGQFARSAVWEVGPGVLYNADGQHIADTLRFSTPIYRYNEEDDRVEFRWSNVGSEPESEPEPETDYEIDDAAFDALFP